MREESVKFCVRRPDNVVNGSDKELGVRSALPSVEIFPETITEYLGWRTTGKMSKHRKKANILFIYQLF